MPIPLHHCARFKIYETFNNFLPLLLQIQNLKFHTVSVHSYISNTLDSFKVILGNTLARIGCRHNLTRSSD